MLISQSGSLRTESPSKMKIAGSACSTPAARCHAAATRRSNRGGTCGCQQGGGQHGPRRAHSRSGTTRSGARPRSTRRTWRCVSTALSLRPAPVSARPPPAQVLLPHRAPAARARAGGAGTSAGFAAHPGVAIRQIPPEPREALAVLCLLRALDHHRVRVEHHHPHALLGHAAEIAAVEQQRAVVVVRGAHVVLHLRGSRPPLQGERREGADQQTGAPPAPRRGPAASASPPRPRRPFYRPRHHRSPRRH